MELSDDTKSLEEVVVTGERKDENVRSTILGEKKNFPQIV